MFRKKNYETEVSVSFSENVFLPAQCVLRKRNVCFVFVFVFVNRLGRQIKKTHISFYKELYDCNETKINVIPNN